MPPQRSPPKFSWLNGISAFVHGKDPEEERAALFTRNHSKLMKAVAHVQFGPRHERLKFWQQVRQEFKAFFLGTKLNVLLVFVPMAAISKFAGWGDGPTCALGMIALVPLAERLGFVTEELASYTNDSVGGLLNATFGNATELIISAFALKANLLRVVQLSLLGSVVSNLLLVMGTAFLAGGITHPQQTFSKEAISVHCALLLLAVVAILLPTMLKTTRTEASIGADVWGQDAYPLGSSSLILSRIESIALLLCYILFLFFQLFTHKHLYEGMEEGSVSAGGGGGGGGNSAAATPPNTMSRTTSGRSRRDLEMGELGGGGGMRGGALPGGSTPGGQVQIVPSDQTPQGRNSRTSSGRPILKRPEAEIDEATVPLVLGAGVVRSLSRCDLEANSREIGDQDSGGDQHQATGSGAREAGSNGGAGGGSDDDDEGPELSIAGCFAWMTFVTALIAVLSEWIVSAIEGASRQLNVPLPFLVTILLPIVGNAAEHASAVMFAVRDRIELALGVAVGSSTQVSVLLIPFCVVLAWMMGRPLDLNFSAFELSVFFISVLLSIIVLQEGSSNYLKGVLLMLTYLFVAAGFWCHQDETLSEEQPNEGASSPLAHLLRVS